MLFENMQNTIFRYRGYWEILDKMLGMVEHNESIGNRLSDLGISSVCVYGVGIIGRHLIQNLRDSSIRVVACIDSKVKEFEHYTFIMPSDEVPPCDAVINTVTYDEQEIESNLFAHGASRVINIKEILNITN